MELGTNEEPEMNVPQKRPWALLQSRRGLRVSELAGQGKARQHRTRLHRTGQVGWDQRAESDHALICEFRWSIFRQHLSMVSMMVNYFSSLLAQPQNRVSPVPGWVRVFCIFVCFLFPLPSLNFSNMVAASPCMPQCNSIGR